MSHAVALGLIAWLALNVAFIAIRFGRQPKRIAMGGFWIVGLIENLGYNLPDEATEET